MLYPRLLVANQKAKKAFKKWHRNTPEHMRPEVGIYRKTKVRCSNPFCCGNPRRAKGTYEPKLTVQERKAPKINEWE